MLAAETRLLYENASTAIVATVVIASVLAYAQSAAISRVALWGWLSFMLLVSAARLLLARRYWRASPGSAENDSWNAGFVVGTALAAAGWGAAAFVLYSPARPNNETFLVFVVGGVMLGGASLLAARREAFLTFLVPTGLLTTVRLAAVGDQTHMMMGFLTALFTAATVATTWRFHRAIESSFRLRFDNDDLIVSLQTAKQHADALNRDLEMRVSDRTARLVEADKRKDEFLAMLAHELRNPLAPVRFALEILKTGGASQAVHAREVIERQVLQLVRLVDDLLDVARITANKIHLRREPHEMGRLMATAVESIMPLATASEHQLHVRMPPAPIPVDGDGARLVQVFANVLHNAVKFTPRGGRISFTIDDQSTEAVLRIRDTGIGIAPEVLPHVFDMFHQAAPILERPAGGLGIGLTLARRLIEMHGGRIVISSPGLGRGTEVEIHLPVVSQRDITAAAERQPSTAAPGSNLRVLIVEDNLDAAEMLELTVSQLGHATKVAHDGATAIAVATEFTPDLILLDIGLPIMSGYAVAQALRERPDFSHVHIAAITGWGHEDDRRRAREAGFDSHFTKPLAPDALEALLATMSHRHIRS